MTSFLGMYRQARTAHAQHLTGETFISLGTSAVSARDVCAQGGLLALSAGQMRNHAALCRALKLTYDAQPSRVVMRAYQTWGADYPRHIEGPAVTAVIDRAEDRLILSRDRMGVVPVFYAWRARSAAFAGRPELLLRAGAAGRVVNREGLCEMFLKGGARFGGHTPFRDIRALEPGCVLVADARGTRVKRYFSLTPQAHTDGPEAAAEAVREALARAVGECARFSPCAAHSGGRGSRALYGLLPDSSARAYHFCVDEAEAGAPAAPHCEIRATAREVFDARPDAVLAGGFPSRADACLHLFARGFGEPGAHALFAAGARALNAGVCVSPGETPESAPDWPGEIGGAPPFLRADVFKRLDAAEYARERLRDALARAPRAQGDTPAQADARARAALYWQWALPAECERIQLTFGFSGRAPLFPFADERLAQYLLGAPGAVVCAGGDGLLSMCARDNRAQNAPVFADGGFSAMDRAETARLVRDETLRVTDDDAQPVCELIDVPAVRAAARAPHIPVRALNALLNLNDWMMQNEAEVSL